MIVTKSKLTQIIKEELKHVLEETYGMSAVRDVQALLDAVTMVTNMLDSAGGEESAAMQQYEMWAKKNMNLQNVHNAGKGDTNILTPASATEFYYAIERMMRRGYRASAKDFEDTAMRYKDARARGLSDEEIAGGKIQGGDDVISTLKVKAVLDKLEAALDVLAGSLKA